ncbi:MAG TPA: beta-N-acetylhexosaminidase [Terriglobales bacterium]|jgi:beta-N-acetylhexosaminidase|nr:beta-N-acetylhexosaminidase [Terriglobales bacterium]
MSDSKLAVGQLLIIGFDGAELSPRLASLLTKTQPAGVILFARSIKTAEQTQTLLRECQKHVATPLFTCVDLEGGTVDRFRSAIGPSPCAAEVFATGSRALFRKHGRIIGENCRALGFNVDFAPVLDLAYEASRSVMSSRAVSDDPKQVVIYAREFLRGLNEAGILGCGKHFPGLGEATLDTHQKLPSVEKPLRKLWEQDLVPYRVLRRELPMVMVSHAAFPAITEQSIPASLSRKWITDILRKKIGYTGLIVSDDMEMGAVQDFAPIEQSVVQYIRGGGDLALVCHKEEIVVRAYEALTREAERDPKFARRARESARRILAFKKRWMKSDKTAPPKRSALRPEQVEKLSRQLWEFGEEIRMAALARTGKNAEKKKARA